MLNMDMYRRHNEIRETDIHKILNKNKIEVDNYMNQKAF